MFEQVDKVCVDIASDNESEDSHDDFEPDFAADLDKNVQLDSEENGRSESILFSAQNSNHTLASLLIPRNVWKMFVVQKC